MAAFNDNTITTLKSYGVPLCVECRFCGNKRLMEPGQLRGPKMVHDYASLGSVARHLKCTGCGAKEPMTKVMLDREKAEAWLRGEPTEQ